MAKYHQGMFKPKHPEKYVGDVNNIVWRSSWELKFLIWLDDNPSVVSYSSEEVVIPYISPVDNKPHRYFVDFAVLVKSKDGTLKKVLIEIKPLAQTQMPKRPKMITERYMSELKTYAVNQAKWKAASEWCKKAGMEFHVFTEVELGIKNGNIKHKK